MCSICISKLSGPVYIYLNYICFIWITSKADEILLKGIK